MSIDNPWEPKILPHIPDEEIYDDDEFDDDGEGDDEEWMGGMLND